MARAKFPGSPASLDALCKRFDISLTSRNKHGAIIDSELLAQVYLELNGGRARSLGLSANKTKQIETVLTSVASSRPNKLEPRLTELEKEQHRKFIAKLGDEMMWKKHWARQN